MKPGIDIKFLAHFEYEIKKSKFLSFAYQVNSIEEINQILNALKKEHKKARHICYGFKIDAITKASDDGEPKGVASLPIINAINTKKLNNLAIFVVRYFGNIKLGVGGLYRAYSKSTLELLKKIIN